MAGGERPSGPADGSEVSEPRVRSLIDLDTARTDLGDERAHGRTNLRDKQGLLEVDSENAQAGTGAEFHYRAAVLTEAYNAALDARENGATQEAIVQAAAKRLADEMLLREHAEANARNNPETLRGRLTAKFEQVWRKHPVYRFAIGVGLVVAAGAATASGLTAIGIGLAAVRGGMGAVGGYMGARAAQEMGGSLWRHSRGSMKPLGPTDEAAEAVAGTLTDDERWKHFAGLLSSEATKGRGKKRQEQDTRTEAALYRAEVEAGAKEMKERIEQKAGTDPELAVRAIMEVLDQRLAGQLLAERQQLQDDIKVNRRRTFVAATIGVASGAFTTVTGIDHASVSGAGHAGRHGARHTAGRVHEHIAGRHGGGGATQGGGRVGGTHGGGAEQATGHHGTGGHPGVAGTEAAEHAAHPTEVHPSSFQHYPEIVTDQVDKGDTPYKVALKHLTRVQGWSHFSAADQHEKAMHFANQLTRNGDHWRYTKEAIKASFNFHHGVVVEPGQVSGAGHLVHNVMPTHSDVAPTGGTPAPVEHAFTGGTMAPDTHEFGLAPNYPEIVTEPVRWGDSTMGVAHEFLSRVSGWDQFTEPEKHAKALHFANQIRKAGDHWRFTKEAIQASFNFKR